MPQPHALIVDDSKTAQMRLRKMLERYQLEIDTASSAEEALSYLSYQSPAVVFMDHHMEGMDGLEALRIMKSNPATAMIPVIMYTSEKGDVYVGQARAMGALDIISKEVIKPSSLAKVLSSLNIESRSEGAKDRRVRRDRRAPVDAATRPAQAETLASGSSAGNAELYAVRNQVARLFEIHIADVRQQVADSTKFIVRRLSGDIEDRLAAAKTSPEADDIAPVPETREGSGASLFFSTLILLGLLLVAYQVVSAGKIQRELARNLDRLAAMTEEHGNLLQELDDPRASMSAAAAIPATTPAGASSATTNDTLLLEAVSWAMSLDPAFEFGRPALADERTGEFAQLLNLLAAAQYRGTLFVDLHFGNFCVVRAENGELALPDASASMADCTLLSDLDIDFPVEDHLSLGFVSFMQTQPALAQNKLDMQLHSRGLSDPLYFYPTPMPNLKAAHWNSFAQRNNRIALSFSPPTANSM